MGDQVYNVNEDHNLTQGFGTYFDIYSSPDTMEYIYNRSWDTDDVVWSGDDLPDNDIITFNDGLGRMYFGAYESSSLTGEGWKIFTR